MHSPNQDALIEAVKQIDAGAKRTGLDELRPAFRGRGLEIAQLKARGVTNKRTAEIVGVDERTITNYITGEIFQLLLEEVREKAIDQQSDLTERLKDESTACLDTLIAIRDDIEASPDTRRRTAMDLLALLKDPPGGKEHVKQTIKVFMNPPSDNPKVLEGSETEAQARVVPIRKEEEGAA